MVWWISSIYVGIGFGATFVLLMLTARLRREEKNIAQFVEEVLPFLLFFFWPIVLAVFAVYGLCVGLVNLASYTEASLAGARATSKPWWRKKGDWNDGIK